MNTEITGERPAPGLDPQPKTYYHHETRWLVAANLWLHHFICHIYSRRDEIIGIISWEQKKRKIVPKKIYCPDIYQKPETKCNIPKSYLRYLFNKVRCSVQPNQNCIPKTFPKAKNASINQRDKKRNFHTIAQYS